MTIRDDREAALGGLRQVRLALVCGRLDALSPAKRHKMMLGVVDTCIKAIDDIFDALEEAAVAARERESEAARVDPL